jgi:hypothetical protein
MKKRFIAFYDVLCFSIIALVMWTIALIILFAGKLEDYAWSLEYWYLHIIFAICFFVPMTLMFFIQNITIDLKCNKFDAYYLVAFLKNDKDLNSNWSLYPSEVESVELVKLSKEEKKKYTSAKFLFNKYLKINLKYGHSKYVYISHYSHSQIISIKRMLVSYIKK